MKEKKRRREVSQTQYKLTLMEIRMGIFNTLSSIDNLAYIL